jgi:hypothetical protein
VVSTLHLTFSPAGRLHWQSGPSGPEQNQEKEILLDRRDQGQKIINRYAAMGSVGKTAMRRGGAGVFAQNLLSRYGLRRNVQEGASLDLASPARPMLLRVSSHLNFAVTTGQAHSEGVASERTIYKHHRLYTTEFRRIETLVRRLEKQEVTLTPAIQLVTRLSQRAERVEPGQQMIPISPMQRPTGNKVKEQAGSAPMIVAAIPPAQIILRKTAPRISEEDEASPFSDRRSLPEAAAIASAVRNPGPPAINVDQLAEQVMRTIDKRILAYRERTGRR